jgi:hypothetical protein
VAGQQGRLGFPPFDIFSSQLLAGVIMTIGLPQGPIMYQAAPPELRARTYVLLAATQIKASMDEAEKQGAPGFDAWFPPTPDVDRVREQMRQYLDQTREKGRTELK